MRPSSTTMKPVKAPYCSNNQSSSLKALSELPNAAARVTSKSKPSPFLKKPSSTPGSTTTKNLNFSFTIKWAKNIIILEISTKPKSTIFATSTPCMNPTTQPIKAFPNSGSKKIKKSTFNSSTKSLVSSSWSTLKYPFGL